MLARPDGYIPPCLPTLAIKPPSGADWVHEIKHDGYRLQVRREGDSVRLFTRRSHDWSARYPAIARTAAQLKARSFTLDGEAVVYGPDGVAIFDALHRHGTVSQAMLYAFDLLELDGEDLRPLPFVDRKRRLAKLVRQQRLGIVLSEQCHLHYWSLTCECQAKDGFSDRYSTDVNSDNVSGPSVARDSSYHAVL
jgi:bifunctional non-homologous end joining protein LigD